MTLGEDATDYRSHLSCVKLPQTPMKFHSSTRSDVCKIVGGIDRGDGNFGPVPQALLPRGMKPKIGLNAQIDLFWWARGRAFS